MNDQEYYRIGDANPLIGAQVKVTWLKRWGIRDAGYSASGELVKTFVVQGRVLLGAIKTESGETITAPWSKNYLEIEAI